jgi:DNA-binding transcriptional LysR family regulator
MRGIELRHLATLAAIADEQTFGRAASLLGYTQSTVSQHIAALEKAVGGAVFDRPGGPRPVQMTALGSLVLGRGRDLLADADRLAEAVDRFQAGDGRIDIGTFQSVSNVILPALVRQLRDEQPGCEIRLSEEEPDEPQMGQLDLLFYDGRLGGEVAHCKLLNDPYLLVARPGDFPDGPTRLVDLDGLPMVAWPATCDQPRMEQALIDSGVRPRIVFRTAGNETVLSMVRAGLGVALMPWLAVHGANVWSDDQLHVHSLRPAPAREIHLHWPAGRTQSPLAARAIEIAVEIADKLSAQRDHDVSSNETPTANEIGTKTTR